MGPPIPVIPAQAGIQDHTHKSRLPPWTPDQVRGDDVSDKRALTLKSAASRRRKCAVLLRRRYPKAVGSGVYPGGIRQVCEDLHQSVGEPPAGGLGFIGQNKTPRLIAVDG